jgi:tRNA(Ile)-lysidine synthase
VEPLRVLLFDVFGTLVDWRSSLIDLAAANAARSGLQADWAAIVDDWRRAYQPALDEVRRSVSEAEGRGAAWTEERATKERATREGGASEAPRRRAGEHGAEYQGPEAAARAARYRALDRAAATTGAAAILLGHTRDDQAETVLLGLARGSGARSLAGMAERNGRYLRPLLGISRAQTRAACAAQNLEPWDDPQNDDPGYARARVRHRLLPALEQELGPGVTEALARSADLLRADADFLDSLAQTAAQRIAEGWAGSAGPGVPVEAVAGLPSAIRSRVLRSAAIAAGCPPGALTAGHVAGLEGLVTGWRGQHGIDLPGGIRGQRRYGKLLFSGGPQGDDPPATPRQASNREGAGGRG